MEEEIDQLTLVRVQEGDGVYDSIRCLIQGQLILSGSTTTLHTPV